MVAINAGTTGALIAIGNTAAVVGFGSIAKNTEAFQTTVALMTQIPGNELIGAAIAVSVIAGLTNGYVVTTIRAICNETHQAAYWAVGALTVVVPVIGLAMAIGLFSIM